MRKCKWCGGEDGLSPIKIYAWEAALNGDEDALLFPMVLSYQCDNVTECICRVVEGEVRKSSFFIRMLRKIRLICCVGVCAISTLRGLKKE